MKSSSFTPGYIYIIFDAVKKSCPVSVDQSSAEKMKGCTSKSGPFPRVTEGCRLTNYACFAERNSKNTILLAFFARKSEKLNFLTKLKCEVLEVIQYCESRVN